jgi:hypothetical protein
MRIGKILLSSLVSVLMLVGVALAAAPGADAESAWWHLSSGSRPAYLRPGGEGTVVVQAVNVGDETTCWGDLL